jgi:hypothetical protein
MPSTSLAEWLLARVTDRTRAGAIMGDLEELAQARGRRWFWAAYLRILAALAWRPAAAFLFGYCSFLVATLVFQRPWAGPGAVPQSSLAAMLQHGVALVPFGVARLIFPIAGPLLAAIMMPLRFVFPYAAVRYGPRDRFVELAGAAYIIMTLVAVDPPVLSPLVAIMVVVGFASALALARWRMPAVALAATLAAGLAAIAMVFESYSLGATYLLEQAAHPRILYKVEMPSAALSFVALLVAAAVCSSLHARLLRSSEIGGAHAEPA